MRLTKDVLKVLEKNHDNSVWNDNSDFEDPPPKSKVTLAKDVVVYIPDTPPSRSPKSLPSNSPASKKPKCNDSFSLDSAELKFEQLYQMFNNFSREMIDLILDLTGHDSNKTVEILLGGIKPHDIGAAIRAVA